MSVVTIELTVNQLLDALRKLSTKEREALLKELNSAKSETAFVPNPEHPAFGIWRDRTDITDSTAFADQLRKSIELRQDESQSN